MSTSSIKNDEDVYDLNLSKFLQTDLLVGYQVKSSFDYKLLKGVFGKDILRNLNKEKKKKIAYMHSLDVFEVERKLQHLEEEVASQHSFKSGYPFNLLGKEATKTDGKGTRDRNTIQIYGIASEHRESDVEVEINHDFEDQVIGENVNRLITGAQRCKSFKGIEMVDERRSARGLQESQRNDIARLKSESYGQRDLDILNDIE